MARYTIRWVAALTLGLAMLAGFAVRSVLAADSPAGKSQAAIDKALAYLKTQQKPDGAWHGEKEPPAISGLVLKAFAQEPKYGPDADFVRKGYEKLLSYQVESGGIYKDLLASYNTAIAISSVAAANKPEYKERLDKAVAYLKSLQWTDKIAGLPNSAQITNDKDPRFGGWGYGSKERPDGSNLNIALDALKDAGLKPEDPAFQNALKFINRMQNRSESNDQPWAGSDGGFVYTPANKGESFAGEFVGPDGRRMLRSYGSLTYAGLKSMIYAGLSKDDPRVKAAWDWISRNWTLDENPGMKLGDPEKAQHGLLYYYYTVARALRAYGEPIIVDAQGKKHDWRVELIDKLTSLQKDGGSFVGDQRWYEDNPVLATSYIVLSLQEAQADLKERPAK